MKIPPRDIENFVNAPNKAARVILIYGPDTGLVKERAKIVAKTVVEDLSDPFNVAHLTGGQIADDPAVLTDEANAMSMMGGDRLVRITDAADKLTVTIKSYLEAPSDQSLVVIEAGDLKAKSSLRKACEAAKNAAAIPCYVEDERDISRFIRNFVQQENYQMDADAIGWLSSQAQGDRARVRSEVEKLIIYKGKSDGHKISLEDAMTICGASGAASIDDLTSAVGLGQAAIALQVYQKLSEEGISFIVVVRSLQNHFKRLHQARCYMDAGKPADMAMKSLSPPVFFKTQNAFRAQLNKFGLSSLQKALDKLMQLEADCKKTGMPVDTLCAQTILGLSKLR